MAIFKFLRGDSSRINMDTTPFHEGYAYFTPDDGGFYIDAEVNGEQKRIRINPPGNGTASKAIYSMLYANQWNSGRQTIAIEDIKADTNGIIGLAHDVSGEELEAANNAILYVSDQADGLLTVAAYGDVPTTDIPVMTIIIW